MQGQETTEPQTTKAELARLRVKRAETKDPDIRKALDERIAQLEALLPKPEEKAPDVEEVPPEPPTPEQAAEAENLVRQARVEKMRGNARGATDLLKKASEVAPGSPVVLETLGDDLVERKQFPAARDAYKRAWKLDEKNVGLERKYATLVAQVNAAGSIDQQLRYNLSDSFGAESYGSIGAATLLTVFLPGLGHVAVLKKSSGYFIIGAWVLCGLWLFTMYPDLVKLANMAKGGSTGSPNMTVMVPALLMAIIYFGTLASLQSAKKTYSRKRVDRPMPPVNLPFEFDENAPPTRKGPPQPKA